MGDSVCDCGRLIQQNPRGARRKKCFICAPRRDRSNRRKTATVTQLPLREVDPDSGLTGTVKRQLEQWGMLARWEGVAAIKIAELIDQGHWTASGAAGTTKALRESMQFCLEHSGADKEGDVIEMIFNSKD